jgi:DNA-binding transcriptional LysR family regulator
MELNQFRHVLALAEEGHFGRAAKRLRMTQPPLSQSIQRIERELGVALFERTRKGIHLTAAGQALLPEARAAIAAADRAKALAHAAVQARNPVRIGVASTALWGPLPALLSAARAGHIPLQFIEASTNSQLQLLADGRLDIGLLSPPFDAPQRLQVMDLSRDPLVAALPARAAPKGKRDIPLSLLADQLILFPESQGPTLHSAIMRLFASHGLTPLIVQEVQDMLPTLALVAAGVGATLVPDGIARNVPMVGIAYRQLAHLDHVPTWPLALAHMPLVARSPVAELLARWRQSAKAVT